MREVTEIHRYPGIDEIGPVVCLQGLFRRVHNLENLGDRYPGFISTALGDRYPGFISTGSALILISGVNYYKYPEYLIKDIRGSINHAYGY